MGEGVLCIAKLSNFNSLTMKNQKETEKGSWWPFIILNVALATIGYTIEGTNGALIMLAILNGVLLLCSIAFGIGMGNPPDNDGHSY